jgi:hypothetical protein
LSVRFRKFVGLLAMIAFIVFYVGLMVRIGEALPDHWAVKLLFYVVAGLGWRVPLLPLISWMNRER